MLNAITAAQSGHTFIYRGWEVETKGNELAHAILRGGVDKHGIAHPNYHYEDLITLIICMQQSLILKIPPLLWTPIIQTAVKIYGANQNRK